MRYNICSSYVLYIGSDATLVVYVEWGEGKGLMGLAIISER